MRKRKHSLNIRRRGDTWKPWVPIRFYKGFPVIPMEIGVYERFRFITSETKP